MPSIIAKDSKWTKPWGLTVPPANSLAVRSVLRPKYSTLKIELGHQQRALHGRRQARHEKSVVAARIGQRHGAARIAAQAIGHQPLIAGGAFPIAADLTAERQIRDLFIEVLHGRADPPFGAVK